MILNRLEVDQRQQMHSQSFLDTYITFHLTMLIILSYTELRYNYDSNSKKEVADGKF